MNDTPKSRYQWRKLNRIQDRCSYCSQLRVCTAAQDEWVICSKCWTWGLEEFKPGDHHKITLRLQQIRTHQLKAQVDAITLANTPQETPA